MLRASQKSLERVMIDNTQTAALIASRICHDMVEPMSAIIQGLEMMKGEQNKVSADALSLLDHGVGKIWAKLEFYRFAIGGAVAAGDSQLEEGREVAFKLYSALKPELVWSAPAVAMSRPAVRVVLNLLFIANETLARGGSVEITGEAGAVRIVASGPRASLRAPTAAALRGEPLEGGLNGHTIQPAFTCLLARSAGVAIDIIEGEERVEFVARSESFTI
jgi:histidine phosphotransferase ChpT